ncbi:MAG: DoxX family protein [Cyclobacteriaceae bacterium]|nr:DoxX family protein [Cyclobacteriaceae bacterium]
MSSASKRDTIFFWLFTGLFCAFMLTSAIPNIMSTQEWVDVFNELGYPVYMLPFIGVAKLLGISALLVPGFPRIKEWAYAGFFFDLTGAIFSGLMVGGFHPLMLTMLIPLGTGTLSYIFHHRRISRY